VVARVADAVLDGSLRLEPGTPRDVTVTILAEAGVPTNVAHQVVMHALHWPDAFAASDRALQHAAGVVGEDALLQRALAWRPWRAYAAFHLMSR
jgi:AraC family transcriptional regulator of adaptative response / DNA-3-methyladenine glycosylase II